MLLIIPWLGVLPSKANQYKAISSATLAKQHIPTTSFIWNPFLILNAPLEFTDAVTDWREVAP